MSDEIAIHVTVPKNWWTKLRLQRVSPSKWLRAHIETLVGIEEEDIPRGVPAYLYRAILRRNGWWNKKDTFKTHWFPHARYCPYRPTKNITIWIPAWVKQAGTRQLEFWGLSWSEFVRDKLEDFCLSQEQFDRKWKYWLNAYWEKVKQNGRV